jgi:phytoene dehydrogenase-like protein
MSRDHDAIVVGGGHNGLVCAAYLARAGLDVLVLEARDSVGGCASTVDALDGARVNICNCDHTMVLGTPIVEELDLAGQGLRYLPLDPIQLATGWDGWPPWFLFHDPARTLDGLAASHPDEVDRYRHYLRVATPVVQLIRELALAPPTRPTALRRILDRRGRGLRTMLAWSRRSVGDVVRSLFGSDALRAPVVSTGPAVWGLSPETPRTGLGALGYAFRHLTGAGRPEGGSGAFPLALAASIQHAGGTVRTGARVAEILVEGDPVRGVRLDTNEIIEAPTVVAAADPCSALVTWLARPPARALPLVERWRRRPTKEGYESKIDAVVSMRPRLRVVDQQLLDRVGVTEPLVPTVLIIPGLDGIARAHRAMGRGEIVERPMSWINMPSVLDPTMRVGDHDVFSLEVLFTPYGLRGGWDGSGEPARWLGNLDAVVEPGFAEGIRRWRAMTPADYEREFGLDRGYAPGFSGTPLSVFRGRDRELTRYATPVRGLYLTGAGTFPGAGVWGASGRNAATVILDERG